MSVVDEHDWEDWQGVTLHPGGEGHALVRVEHGQVRLSVWTPGELEVAVTLNHQQAGELLEALAAATEAARWAARDSAAESETHR